MKIKKRDHYNVMWAEIWSAPVGTPLIPLGEEFPRPDPDDPKAPKPVWKYEGTAKYVGFSEGFVDDEKSAVWLELRAGTVKVGVPRLIIARGELENPDYLAQIVYFDVRDGVLYPNENGDPMEIFVFKKP